MLTGEIRNQIDRNWGAYTKPARDSRNQAGPSLGMLALGADGAPL
jgi:hypothetical protein